MNDRNHNKYRRHVRSVTRDSSKISSIILRSGKNMHRGAHNCTVGERKCGGRVSVNNRKNHTASNDANQPPRDTLAMISRVQPTSLFDIPFSWLRSIAPRILRGNCNEISRQYYLAASMDREFAIKRLIRRAKLRCVSQAIASICQKMNKSLFNRANDRRSKQLRKMLIRN